VGISCDRERLTYQSVRSGVIDATPNAVWPWLIQMGYDRGGWYAIDRLEKILGVGRFATGGSARHVVAELQDLAVGDRVPLSRRRHLTVTTLKPSRLFVLTLPKSRLLAWMWQFALTEDTPGTTRLTITTVITVPARFWLKRAAVRGVFGLLHLGHGVMERVQLRTLARRVPQAR
jgi:hypothetical protein